MDEILIEITDDVDEISVVIADGGYGDMWTAAGFLPPWSLGNGQFGITHPDGGTYIYTGTLVE